MIGDGVRSAIQRIQNGLGEDPRIEKVGSREGPRDLLFTEKVIHWIDVLEKSPGEALLLAAWGHDLYRWRLPRDSQPMTTGGYHKWRRAQAVLSADEVSKILHEEKLFDPLIVEVRDLILKKDFPKNQDAQILEDADCLAFMELKFEDYISAWDEPKTIRILKGTLEKMTPRAVELAKGLAYSPEAKQLIAKALS